MPGSKPNYMNSELILKSDILDIVFEKRNKAYGAYVLRKLYTGHLKFSLGIMLLIAAAFTVFTLLPPSKRTLLAMEFVIDETKLTKAETEKVEPPKAPEPPRAEVKQPPAAVVPGQVKFTSNMSFVDDRERISPLQTIDENTVISNVTITASVPGTPLVQPVTTTAGSGAAEAPKVDKNIPLALDAVDVAPSFPGGMEALLNFLRRHLSNPEPMGEGESVTVKVTFVVGYEGKLKSFKVTEDGGEQFNKEVIRVLKKMPDWIPGKAKGESVAVYYTIPVKFTGAD